MLIYGINPVLEALRARRVTAIRVSRARRRARDGDRAAGRASGMSRSGASTADELDRARARRRAPGRGRRAARTPSSFSVEDLVIGATGAPLIVVLDGIEDPQNVGAILRTVDAAGADGVVRQSRHAAPLDGAAAKASAGAVSHVKIAEVVNIARALEELKEAGVWTVGLAGDAPKRYDEMDLTLPTALVVGAEGTGCGGWCGSGATGWSSIPMRGARSEPERVGGGRGCAVRGGPAAAHGGK